MIRWLAFAWALLVPWAALAHKPSDSYLTVRAASTGSELSVRWDIALRDLDYVLELDRDGDGQLAWGEVRTRSEDIVRYATERLAFSAGATACPWGPAAPLQLNRHSDGTYAVLTLVARCETPEQVAVRYSLLFDVDPSHRGLLQWLAPGSATAQALVFPSGNARQTLASRPPDAWETLRQYGVEGVWHIWIGFDHILFLLALLLPAVLVRVQGRWEPAPSLKRSLIEVVKVVTAFTVAHSVTLTLAALGAISLPSRFVEATIAASVIVAALSNLWGTGERRRWAMAFGFGLIHGFGFASVLADLGLPQEALAIALLGFNVGVELGQVAIVAVFVPVAFALRHTVFYRKGVLTFGSLLVAAIAAYWFVQRAFDIEGPF